MHPPAPLRVDHQPSLGDQLVFQTTEPAPYPRAWSAVDTEADLVPAVELAARLDLLIAEIQGLRADLASRTVLARVRRLWARIYAWLETP